MVKLLIMTVSNSVADKVGHRKNVNHLEQGLCHESKAVYLQGS